MSFSEADLMYFKCGDSLTSDLWRETCRNADSCNMLKEASTRNAGFGVCTLLAA